VIKLFLIVTDILNLYSSQNSLNYRIKDCYLLLNGNRLSLTLLQYLYDTFTLGKSLLGILVKREVVLLQRSFLERFLQAVSFLLALNVNGKIILAAKVIMTIVM